MEICCAQLGLLQYDDHVVIIWTFKKKKADEEEEDEKEEEEEATGFKLSLKQISFPLKLSLKNNLRLNLGFKSKLISAW